VDLPRLELPHPGANASAGLIHDTYNDGMARSTSSPPGKAGSGIFGDQGAVVTPGAALVDDTNAWPTRS
jgi:hypothetical protein